MSTVALTQVAPRYFLTAPAPRTLRRLISLPEAAELGACFFESPDGWSFEGLGEACVLEAAGPGRLQELALAARAAFAPITPLSEGEAMPLRFAGGFAFAPGTPGDPWRSFPSARLTLPEFGILRTPSASTMFAVAPRGLEAADAQVHLARTLRRLRSLLVRPAALRAAPQAAERQADSDAFEQGVQHALQRINGGNLHKVTLARAEAWSRTLSDYDPETVLSVLGQRYPGCFKFWVQPAGGPAFVGASPERLLSRVGDILRTEALAGTVACSGDDERDAALAAWLRASPKERREHDIVVHFLRERLANISLRLDLPDEPEILRLANVQHLRTPITARLDPDVAPWGVLQMAERLHPTPAVAGVPTEGALAWLADHDGVDRGWYAGGVGVVDPAGDGEFCVAIRSALLAPEGTWLYAGAGIVDGSDPAQERVETEHKLRGMREVLCG